MMCRARRRTLPLLLALTLGGARHVGAQEPVQLQVAATATEGRSYVSAVAELPDGRLVVVDMMERSVLVYGPTLDTPRTVGRSGQGPTEYLAPQGLTTLPDGRILVRDPGNGRLLELGLDGVPTGNVVTAGDLPTQRVLGIGAAAPVVDHLGRWTMRGDVIRGDDRNGMMFDSLVLARWSGIAGEPMRPIASMPIQVRSRGGAFRISTSWAPFSVAAADWAVCRNGTAFVVLPEPYRVRVFSDAGRMVEGPVVDYRPVAVTDAWVERWWKEVGQRPNDVLQVGFGSGSSVEYRVPERTDLDLPDHLPSIKRDAAHCGPDDRLWVERHVAADELPRIDVFDGRGVRIQRFDLPMGSRIVGFGASSVYVVLRDEVDLEYVVRLEVPTGSGG